MMVRKKLAVVVAALGALQSGVVSALGLGELALESSLNQPLNAEIRLLNIGELDTSQVLVRLANKEDFDRAGISRDYFLTRMKFKVDIDKNGNGTIRLNTTDRVVEPYLNFLVEARWPSGRLLREYTVLLDLPVFSQAQPTAAAQVATPVIEQVRNQPKTNASSAAATSSRAATGSSARQQLAGGQLQPGEDYRVRQSETLWEIAAKARPDANVSVQQTMVTIQRLNPKAFIKGNINTLKAGYVLRLPTESEVQRISDHEASSEVAVQNRAWKTGEDLAVTRGAQLDATSSKPASTERAREDSRLSIATPGSSTDGGFSDGEGQGGGGNASALREKLGVAEEQLVKSQRDNDEMASRLGDMEAKMATLQRLLELKEDQLSALQNNTGAATEPGMQPEQLEAEADLADTDATAETEMTASEVNSEAEKAPEKPPAVKPESTSFIDNLLSNPLYAGLGLGALVLALVAVLMGRRRKESDDQQPVVADNIELELDEAPEADLAEVSLDEELATPEESVAEDEFEGMSVGDFATDMDLAPEEELSFDSSLDSVPETDQAPAASVQSETGDAIAEADIYVAYGRYQQAIDLLSGAIAAEPQRSDLYVKLLEVCVETRDKPAFQQHYTALQGLGDDAAIAQVKEMLSTVDGVSDWLEGLSAAPSDFSNADMDAELIEGDAADAFDGGDTIETEAIDLSVDDELDIDLDLDLDLDGDELDSFAGSTTTQFDVADLEAQLAEENDDLELDLELDLDSSADAAGDSELASLDDELDLNLDVEGETVAADESLGGDNDELGLAGLDLDGGLDSDSDLDLELDELSLDSDLGDLASEFGESTDQSTDLEAGSLDSEFDGLTLTEELDGDLEISAELGAEDDGELLDLSADFATDLDLSQSADLTDDASLSANTEEDLDLELNLGSAAEELSGLDEIELDSESEGFELDALEGLSESDSDFDLSSLEDSPSLSDDATVVGMPAIDMSAIDVAPEEASESDIDSAVADLAADDEDFDFLADTDEVATKLDLARAYIDMGDTEGARDILDEVVQEGNDEQKLEAGSLIERIE